MARLSDRGFVSTRGLSKTETGTASAIDALLPLAHGLGAVPNSLELWVEVSAGNWEQHDASTYFLSTSTQLVSTGTTLEAGLGSPTVNVRLVASSGAVALSVEEASLTKAGIVSTGAQSFAGVKTFASDPTFTSGSQLVTSGAQSIGGAKTFTGSVSLQNGNADSTTTSIGADSAAFTVTDATNKLAALVAPHYSSATEEPVGIFLLSNTSTANSLRIGSSSSNFNSPTEIRLYTAANNTTVVGTERVRIDSSGNVGIGTPTPLASLHTTGDVFINHSATDNYLYFSRQLNVFTRRAWIGAVAGTTGNAQALSFGTNINGADGTEKMFISETGAVTLGPSTLTSNHQVYGGLQVGTGVTTSLTQEGVFLGGSGSAEGYIKATRDSATIIAINRQTNDGELITFHQGNTQEGSITVSGTTVSYNGAHLARWSQFDDNSTPQILRGTVMSSTGTMAKWEGEDNEQLTCSKISDVVGDTTVSGVFDMYDHDDEQTNPGDFYVAQTGDFVIRIASGVTVQVGDLLESAGDGTAKPQADNIVRASTIAKVLSSNPSTTYQDGSFCVPCLLMIC